MFEGFIGVGVAYRGTKQIGRIFGTESYRAENEADPRLFVSAGRFIDGVWKGDRVYKGYNSCRRLTEGS